MQKRTKLVSLFMTLILFITTISYGTFNYASAAKVENVIYQKDNCKIVFKINSEWETGFEAQLIINNTGNEIIKDWEASFDFPYEINTI